MNNINFKKDKLYSSKYENFCFKDIYRLFYSILLEL